MRNQYLVLIALNCGLALASTEQANAHSRAACEMIAGVLQDAKARADDARTTFVASHSNFMTTATRLPYEYSELKSSALNGDNIDALSVQVGADLVAVIENEIAATLAFRKFLALLEKVNTFEKIAGLTCSNQNSPEPSEHLQQRSQAALRGSAESTTSAVTPHQAPNSENGTRLGFNPPAMSDNTYGWYARAQGRLVLRNTRTGEISEALTSLSFVVDDDGVLYAAKLHGYADCNLGGTAEMRGDHFSWRHTSTSRTGAHFFEVRADAQIVDNSFDENGHARIEATATMDQYNVGGDLVRTGRFSTDPAQKSWIQRFGSATYTPCGT